MSEHDEEQYLSFPVRKVYPDKPLPGDLFLFLSGHFVKYKTAGDDLPSEKYEYFLLQKVQFFFINQEDTDKYKKWSEDLAKADKEELVARVGEENREVVEKSLAVQDEFFSFITKEVTQESVREMVVKTRDFIQTIKDKGSVDKFTTNLLKYSQSVADHSTNVANMSVFLAMNTGYSQQIILENIYLGAVLHDYGKTKIDSKISEKPKSRQYKTAMMKHPELGKRALLMDSGFPDEVLRIIAEHHERHDGSGFPKGIKGSRIYGLTKIVSIANVFDNLVMKGSGEIRVRQIKAFKTIEADQGKLFDPKILEKCLRALEPIIK